MSCNCKNANRLQHLMPNANNKIHEKKGISFIFHKMLSKIQNFSMKIVILLIVLILLPIVFLGIAINLFLGGKASMPLPKKLVQKIIKNSQDK